MKFKSSVAWKCAYFSTKTSQMIKAILISEDFDTAVKDLKELVGSNLKSIHYVKFFKVVTKS